MHSFSRRSPVERARHQLMRKRAVEDDEDPLGFDGFGPIRPIVTTTITGRRTTVTTVITIPPTRTPPVVTIRPPVLTSLLPVTTTPVITTTGPATVTTTPATTSTTPVVTTPSTTSTPPVVSTPPTSNRQVTQTITSTSLDANATQQAAANGTSQAAKSGLSGGAIGAIIAASVLAGIVVIVLLVRSTLARRRRKKRNTWGAGFFPGSEEEKYKDANPPPPVPEKPISPSATGTSFNTVGPAGAGIGGAGMGMGMGANGNAYARGSGANWAQPSTPQSTATYFVAPPPLSYNNPMTDQFGRAGSPANFMGPSAPAVNGNITNVTDEGETALVRVLFIPTLPDELSITVGEVVRVVKAFDDGWALCANVRGDQGVVPVECLDRTAKVSFGQLDAGGGDWRNMKRMSSLVSQPVRY